LIDNFPFEDLGGLHIRESGEGSAEIIEGIDFAFVFGDLVLEVVHLFDVVVEVADFEV
jgi:hypothetical protein